MVTILVLILIISLLVLVHEFGHFFAAKLSGVMVEEFGLGLPPRLFGKKLGETVYSLNLLPFGGFVKLTGEDFDEAKAGDPRSFVGKKPIVRAAILTAGVFMNVVLAIALYYTLFSLTNYKSATLPMFFDHHFRYGNVEKLSTVVTSIVEGSLAEKAGISRGEAILEISGTPVYNAGDVRNALASFENREASVLLMDIRGTDRAIRTLYVTPQKDSQGQILLGVLLSDAFRLDYSNNKKFSGLMHTWNMFSYSTSTLGNLISMSVRERDISPVSESVSGPVGISRAVSGILDFRGRDMWIGLLDLTALLSVSLAFLNILPFPALDGGRLAFVVVEAFAGRKVSHKIETSVHKWGMLFLLTLIILVTIKDVRNLL